MDKWDGQVVEKQKMEPLATAHTYEDNMRTGESIDFFRFFQVDFFFFCGWKNAGRRG